MIQEDDFKGTLKTLLAEAFGVSENPHGYFLDSGQAGFLAILDHVSAEIASQSVRSGNATIAAHCEHVNFILDVVRNPEIDWAGSWHLSTVNEQEWQQVRQTLRQRYEALIHAIDTMPEWNSNFVGGAMIILTHCVYHLGEVRQMLSVLLPRTSAINA